MSVSISISQSVTEGGSGLKATEPTVSLIKVTDAANKYKIMYICLWGILFVIINISCLAKNSINFVVGPSLAYLTLCYSVRLIYRNCSSLISREPFLIIASSSSLGHMKTQILKTKSCHSL